ncbi:MAG: TetR/AcrR family transcriptional regulator [Myxococcota bacterium]
MTPNVELRTKILEEAIGIVYREGVDRVTMRSLAAKLGLSPAAIYLHFRNKEELEFEIGFHGFDLLWVAMAPAFSRADPQEALAEVLRRYMNFGIENPELYRLMFQDMTRLQAGGFPEDPRVARVRQGVVSVYRRGVESGDFRSCDAELETAVGWAWVHGFVQLVNHGQLPSHGLSSVPSMVRDTLIEQRVQALAA